MHPTDTGYAVLANEFLEALHDSFHARGRRVDLGEVAASDPLVPSLARDDAGHADHVKAEKAHAVRAAWRARQSGSSGKRLRVRAGGALRHPPCHARRS